MKKLTMLVIALFAISVSFSQNQGKFSFGIDAIDITTPLATTANLGYFMTDDILVSLGMDNWDDFMVSARYYGICENMFVEATTTATNDGADGSTYAIGAAVGWSLDLGIWKLQFEPKIALADIQDFTPMLTWGLRFNL